MSPIEVTAQNGGVVWSLTPTLMVAHEPVFRRMKPSPSTPRTSSRIGSGRSAYSSLKS
jgi:hypothetical protein